MEKFIITADLKSWTLGGLEFSKAFVLKTKNEGNQEWKLLKENSHFHDLHASKGNPKELNLTLFQKKQGEKPFFATIEYCDDMDRLLDVVYGKHDFDCIKIVLPDIPFKKMQFDNIEKLNAEEYCDEYDDWMELTVVRERMFGQKFIISNKNVRYDEMMTNREDVCEIRLHPYCSDFNLVKDIELGYDDYDM